MSKLHTLPLLLLLLVSVSCSHPSTWLKNNHDRATITTRILTRSALANKRTPSPPLSFLSPPSISSTIHTIRGGSIIHQEPPPPPPTTTADPVIIASILSIALAITATSIAILTFAALPSTISPARKSLASALAIYTCMAGIEELGGRKGNHSPRHAILSSIGQGIGIASAGAVVFSVLWSVEKYCIDGWGDGMGYVGDDVVDGVVEGGKWYYLFRTGSVQPVPIPSPSTAPSSPSPFQYCGPLERYTSTLTTATFGAFIGACLESFRHIARRPPHYVQQAVPYAMLLLAIHIEPFLGLKYYNSVGGGSEWYGKGSKGQAATAAAARLAFSKTKRIVDISNRYSVVTGVISVVLLHGMFLVKQTLTSTPPSSQVVGDDDDGNAMSLVAYVSRNKALPVLTGISIVVNLLWTFFTVTVWLFKEMPYYGLGVVSVMVAILHFSCWSLLDKDINNRSSSDNNSNSSTNTSSSTTSTSITQAVAYYKILQECILALAICRLIYWEFFWDDVDSYIHLEKHFYSLVASFTAFGVTASYSRSTKQTIASIVAIFALLIRMIVASLFSTGVKGYIIAGSLGLGLGVFVIGGVLAGGL